MSSFEDYRPHSLLQFRDRPQWEAAVKPVAELIEAKYLFYVAEVQGSQTFSISANWPRWIATYVRPRNRLSFATDRAIQRFIRDRYVNWEVYITKGPNKGRKGTVLGTRPGGSILDVRLEQSTISSTAAVKVEHCLDFDSFVPLEEAVHTPAKQMAFLRDLRLSRLKGYHIKPVVPDVGAAKDNWPEVMQTPPESTPPRSDISPPLPPSFQPGGKKPGDWLRQPELKGMRLDVIIRSGGKYKEGFYDNEVGYIDHLPGRETIKTGRRGVVKVWLGGIAAPQNIKTNTQYIFPLLTTEVEGVIPRNEARPVFERWGCKLVIIGPDTKGSTAYIGQLGRVDWEGVVVCGKKIHFPDSSLCRSEENYQLLRGN